MSSDIPGFYFDPVQQRYYRISPQSSNAVPSARLIHHRARQEQLVTKQLDVINSHSQRYKEKKRLIKSRLSLFRQREYGQTSIPLYHNHIRSNFLETLSPTCFLDNSSSFSLQDHSQSYSNYEMTLTSSGQCIQLINYKLYLNLLSNPTYSYQLQANSIDGYRSSYFIDSSSSFMSTTLLNDENHVIIRFLQFSSLPSDHSLLMLSNNPSAPKSYYQEKCETIQLSSSLINYTSPLMIKCSGPCCYSKSFDHFAFNINNYLYIYNLQTFQSICSIRVPIRRVTLNDIKFSYENSNIIYTTNGHQFQQWDIRQSNRLCSIRMPILCSTIKCLQTKLNCILTSSFDERINLIDLRMPTKPLLTYDSSASSSNNPHFSFAIDTDTEHFIAACSQYHIVNIWDLNSGRLLNRLRCPTPERFVHTSTKCSIACVDKKIPVLGIYHPEYCRITGMINKKTMALTLSSNNFEVNIHPVALFNIVHAYERRSEKFDTILGTLLGTRTADSIEVVDSFVVPHSTHSDALYNVDYASTMASFYRKVNSSQTTVGWYSTGSDMISGANLIHEFYTHETRNPVYILVDTSLKNDSSFQIKAYIGAPFGVKDKDKLKSHGTIFTPIPVRLVTYDEEKSAIDLFQAGKFSKDFQVKPPGELDQVQLALDKLLFMLNYLTTYVDEIIAGKKPSDPKIGRMLMNLINTVPRVDAKDLENMVNTSMNDLLMIQYLSQAVKAQLVLNEKLTST